MKTAIQSHDQTNDGEHTYQPTINKRTNRQAPTTKQ